MEPLATLSQYKIVRAITAAGVVAIPFTIVGSVEQAQSILEEEIELLDIDELLAYSPIYDSDKRIASYHHLAKIFNKI